MAPAAPAATPRPAPPPTARTAGAGCSVTVLALALIPLLAPALPANGVDANRDGAVSHAEVATIMDGSGLQIVRDASLRDLLENPTELDFGVERGDLDQDGFVTLTWADLHAVYPVSVDAFRDTLLDFDSHADFVPRVVESPATSVSSDPPRWHQDVMLSFRVLGFGADYVFRTEHVVTLDRTADSDENRNNPNSAGRPTQFGLTFRMMESETETLVDSGGTWFLAEVLLDDTPHTYVRYTNFAAFGRPILGLRLALRNFGLRDVKSVMDAYFREAATR